MKPTCRDLIDEAIDILTEAPEDDEGNRYSVECACDFCIAHRREALSKLLVILTQARAKTL